MTMLRKMFRFGSVYAFLQVVSGIELGVVIAWANMSLGWNTAECATLMPLGWVLMVAQLPVALRLFPTASKAMNVVRPLSVGV